MIDMRLTTVEMRHGLRVVVVVVDDTPAGFLDFELKLIWALHGHDNDSTLTFISLLVHCLRTLLSVIDNGVIRR